MMCQYCCRIQGAKFIIAVNHILLRIKQQALNIDYKLISRLLENIGYRFVMLKSCDFWELKTYNTPFFNLMAEGRNSGCSRKACRVPGDRVDSWSPTASYASSSRVDRFLTNPATNGRLLAGRCSNNRR
jgi:hypothetical protein